MVSSEFVKLFKETPGAVKGGAEGPTSPGPKKKKRKQLQSNDLELIFAREKDRGEKSIT